MITPNRKVASPRCVNINDLRGLAKGRLPKAVFDYLDGGRKSAEGAIERAGVGGVSALVITIDSPVAGMRERDPRNGMVELLTGSVPAKIPFLPQIFAHPGWLASFLFDGGVPKLENV